MANESFQIDLEFQTNMNELLNNISKSADLLKKKIGGVGDEAEKLKKKIYDATDFRKMQGSSKFGGLFSKNSTEGLSKMESGIGSIAKKIPALGAALGVAFGAKEIYEATRKFEKFKAVLNNTINDDGKSRSVLKEMRELPASMPLEEMIQGYTELTNAGITPTVKSMKKMGDMAISQGKSVSGYIQAYSRAMIGEYRGLKEYGVQVEESNGKLNVSFRGQSKTIDSTKSSLDAYLKSLSEMPGIADAGERSTNNMDGQVTELGDSFENLSIAIGEKFIGEGGIFSSILKGLTKFMKDMTDQIETKESELISKKNEKTKELFQSYISSSNETVKKNIIDLIASSNPDALKGMTEFNNTTMQAQGVKIWGEGLKSEEEAKNKEKATKLEEEIKNQIDFTIKAEKNALDVINSRMKPGYKVTSDDLNKEGGLIGWANKKLLYGGLDENNMPTTDPSKVRNVTMQGAIGGVLKGEGFDSFNTLINNVIFQNQKLEKLTGKLSAIPKVDEIVTDDKNKNNDNLSGPTKEAAMDAGRTLKNLNINIDTMVEKGGIVITTDNITESAQKIEQILIENLQKVIIDAQAGAINN